MGSLVLLGELYRWNDIYLSESWRISKSLKLERWGKALKGKKVAWKYEEQGIFWKEQALYYSWGYTEVVQYGYRVSGGEMIQGGSGKLCWEQYVKGIVCLRPWNLYQRKQKGTVNFKQGCAVWRIAV